MASRKVLLVDDEPAIQTLVRLVLQGAGWQVVVGSDGESGLALAREHNPDVVLLDVALPDISGLEVCRQLKADPNTRSIPVVILTAMAEEGDRRAALGLGADDYMTKPWRPAALMAKLSSLVERKEDAK